MNDKVFCSKCRYLTVSWGSPHQCFHSDNLKPSWYSDDKIKGDFLRAPRIRNYKNDCKGFEFSYLWKVINFIKGWR